MRSNVIYGLYIYGLDWTGSAVQIALPHRKFVIPVHTYMAHMFGTVRSGSDWGGRARERVEQPRRMAVVGSLHARTVPRTFLAAMCGVI